MISYLSRILTHFPLPEQKAYINAIAELMLASRASIYALTNYAYNSPVPSAAEKYFPLSDRSHLRSPENGLEPQNKTLFMSREKSGVIIAACNSAFFHLERKKMSIASETQANESSSAPKDIFSRIKSMVQNAFFGVNPTDQSTENQQSEQKSSQRIAFIDMSLRKIKKISHSLNQPFEDTILNDAAISIAVIAFREFNIYYGILSGLRSAAADEINS
jgi:hypothetical protein